jgi:thermitase
VEFAELDRIVPPEGVTPNDPLYASQWHLRKIAAPDAWTLTTGSGSVTIAILDTGVDGTHPDLAGKMVPGWDIYDNSPDASDVYGHGTMVAGTAAAFTNNATGVASVAWNCLIMPVRISDVNGSASYSDIARGLVWAADHGARVANISYMVTTSSTVTSAAQYFYDHGGVVSSSAGNYGKFDSKADNPYILTVSGTDQNDVLYSWSNTGNNVDLAAPGCVGSTTTKGGGYGAPCGTSFSAPIVGGVAALVFSSYGYGRVNAARAVASASGAAHADPPSVTITSPTDGANVSGTVSVTCHTGGQVGTVKVELYVDGVLTGTSTTAPFTMSWNTRKAKQGAHTLTERAYDPVGDVGTSASITVNR